MKSCLRKNRNFAHDNYQEGNGKYLSVAAASVRGKTRPDELTPRIRKKRTKFGRHTE